MSNILETPIQIGAYTLRNKVVMAPLTRMRSTGNFAQPELAVEYYGQRAGAGLIIAEATQISQQGQGYPNTPGIYTDEQIEAYKKITDKVHEEGGTIFLQLWHVGRLSFKDYQPNNSLPVAPSALAAPGHAYLPDFSRADYETPRELTVAEIKEIVEDYRQAAINAKEAGFDGVEIHAANAYLLEQFLKTVSNQRTDEYGGAVENRARLLFEVLDTILTVWDNSKIALRISPFNVSGIAPEPDPYSIYDYVVKRLADYKLAYLHVIENKEIDPGNGATVTFDTDKLYIKHISDFYTSPVIVAGGFDKDKAETVIEKGYASAVAFGKNYISTPDLAYRLVNDLEPNAFDRATFYGGGAKGYTDYPFYKV
ncbi:alkene reductase [Chryseobacterium sp. Marseille-Q3244]|uniref:alkene reductase n=1 Tax=Chryseobacterium sp. Marseille-Q3244 TaxID=2758092 RepID=UPI002024B1A5|nr:alkene reductase [Chryseobacterium sp. Marseille-Q3244]